MAFLTGWNPDIVATVDKVIVDAKNKSVTFQLQGGHCANMTGAINQAIKMLPEVVMVVVMSGREVDRIYTLFDGGWASINPQKQTIRGVSGVQGQD